MDPQERLFLQCVYETLEDAGYTRESLQSQSVGAVGVFVGVMYEEYQLYGAQAQALGQGAALSGNASSIANRVSYFCNFRGPSLALDTMCSSSLTAIHLACESLRRGECSAAIAGGVNVNVHPNKYLALSQGQFASSKGRCQSFGDGGDGYVPGEGIGAVLLKGLHQAIEDGDQIYGVIRGTSINHGGKTNGYTVPNPQAQAQVIEEALQKAGISARQISYIEAHGTGTSLGDPIEIAGLSKAFSRWTQDQRFCAIGSAKSSIGHCESAAGIAGVTKILLQMKHGLLAPSLHAEELNPHIDFANSPFVVQRELGEWRRPLIEVNGETREYPRLAGISAFGAGGSNAHVVIEEYLPRDAEPGVHLKSTVPALIVLSAKDEQRLRERADQLRQALDGGRYTESDLAAIAYTLQVGREAMEQRLGLLVTSLADLREKLTRYASDTAGIEDLYRGEVKRNKEMVSVFAADDELQEAIAKWLERGKYGKLLEVWVKGMVLDWRRLYGERTPRRLSLPGYPFATDRHWFTAAAGDSRCVDVDAAAKPTECPVAAVAGRSARILTKQWLSSPASIETAALQSAIIVATRDTELLANKVAALFSRSHVIDADKSEELDWGSFDTWIDLAGCGATHDASAQWMAQLQRWIQHGREHSRLALCVTRGLESLDNPQANLAGALQAGLYRMLQNEYRNLCSRHMDTDLSPDDSSLVEQIRRECMLREDSNAEICYRNGLRYRACLGETEQATHAIAAPAFAEDDVLWVTGGTQGLGSLCAQHLVSRYGVRRVVLSGRTVLPPRNQWDVHRHRCTDLARKIAVVEALEAQGARVRVSAVCLTDAEAMRAEVLEIRRTLGRIAGVLHCAGTVDLQTPAFIYKSATDIEQVLAPKVTGLDNLIRCIEDEPLQFVILFSSVSAAVPSLAVGQSDYAVANSYMDYIAQAHRPHLPITSVQWSSWKETGFGETTSKPFQEAGLLSQLNAEGLEFLDQVIANRWGPVVLPAVVDAARWQPERLMLKHSRQVSPAKREQQRSTPTHGESPLCCEVSAWVRSTFAAALRIDESKLDDETQLQDYGVDSIILVQLMKPVSQLIGEAVDPSILFEYSTIKSFAAWLASTHAEAFRSAAALPQEHERTVDAVVAQVAEPVPEPIPQLPDSDSSAEDIAVVGMSCRFPGARNLDEYWQLLAQGRSAIGAVSAERGQVREGCYAGLLDNITHFDPAFFQIPDSDAAVIDPQALVVLEESLNTFCHAGLPLRDVKGSNIGVYLGGRSRHRPDAAGLAEARNPIVAVGQNYLAANISRFFDLRGPSLVLDTACSSALVAMNMAVQALRCGEIDAALVGGVSLLNTDTDLALFDQRGLLRKEPQFHIFDKRAGGAIYAEGAGMVLLKTSRQARKDRDTVYAVIKGIAVNNDGRTVGPSAPNVQAQKDVMHAALRKSGLRAQDVEYIDVNGSGSEIPDLLELRAIEAVYRSTGTPVCELGSMKPNIGHPLCAGGIASFIKVVLMLRRRQRVPFLSAEQPNAHYKFETSPFRFARSLAPWENAQATAAINCFADGGTNAHVILQAHAEDSHAGELRQPIAPPVLERVDIGRLNRPVAATVAVRENNVLGFWKRSRPTVAKQVARKSLWQRVEKVAGGL
jgi:polyketide synthase PksN